VVHRAEFLAELPKPVPKHLMHTSKKLVAVSTTDDGALTLSFEDGTTEPADALIGADGIHSFVRKHILGKDHPAAEPVFAGWWDCRNLVP
jgi:salicylate hydroxylase